MFHGRATGELTGLARTVLDEFLSTVHHNLLFKCVVMQHGPTRPHRASCPHLQAVAYVAELQMAELAMVLMQHYSPGVFLDIDEITI